MFYESSSAAMVVNEWPARAITRKRAKVFREKRYKFSLIPGLGGARASPKRASKLEHATVLLYAICARMCNSENPQLVELNERVKSSFCESHRRT